MAIRTALLRELVEDVEAQSFRPQYRKVATGAEVFGWANRLESYFWPNPTVTYRVTAALLNPWFEEAGGLSRVLLAGGDWSTQELTRATELSREMLKWGGVPRQREFSPDVVERVFRRALGISDLWAPMSSGWSKVAALATAYLEGSADTAPQVIWDSRVSSSIVHRLDRVMASKGLDPKQVFPSIGAVAGRGGSRLKGRKTTLKWAHAYGSWSTQSAGSQVVREIRDLLNSSVFPSMPLPAGGTGPWTIRGVESVLFMDGY